MSDWNLGVLFEAVAAAVADREAVVAGDVRLSFAELDDRAGRLARALQDRGVGPGDRVGLLLRNGPEYLEVMLAAFRLRAVPVNLHYRYTTEELAYLVADAGPSVVVHEPDLGGRLCQAFGGLPHRPATIATGTEYEAALAGAAPVAPVPDRSGDDHYILYTGGTTGMPKGVVWRHEDLFFGALSAGHPGQAAPRSIDEFVENARRGRTRCLPASPFTHGTAHWTALATLLGGGTVVVVPGAGFDPETVWDAAAHERVTLLVIVGDAFGRPLADALQAEPDRWDLGHLLSIVSGGAVLSPAVRRNLLDRLPWCVVVDGYGTSETGGHGHMAIWPGQADTGRPTFEVGDDTAVLDEHLHPLPPGTGEVGLLARRGRIPLGYHDDPERTARTFPTIDGERWAVPGDLAMVDADGRVVLLGRGSSSINTGGEKVFPDEVEATLKGHPAVFDAVVVGVGDPRLGERVAAVVQLRPARPATAADLSEHCRRHLADFKTPRQFVFVDALRRRASGKPDYTWARTVLAGDSGDVGEVGTG